MTVNLENIQALVSSGETNKLEFKKSTAQLKGAIETLCAFLNGNGGRILIGVTDNKKIIGQDVTDKTKRFIGNEISKIIPTAEIDIEYIKLDHANKSIISINVNDQHKKPYLYDSKAFMRVETNTIAMTREHYNHLLSTNTHHCLKHWEDIIINDIAISDLDHEEILNTVREGIINGRIPEDFATDDVNKALNHFGLLNNGKLIAAAVILFAKHPEKWLPQCILKLARFRGNSHLADFIDNKQIFGNAFKIINESMTFAKRYLPIASYFPENSLERKDVPLFPLKALREVFANAICHRDYSSPGSSISFAIFDDRLEAWSYGSFLPEVSNIDIKHLHKSVPRNPKIAKVLYYRKINESWGRGINMIIQECTKAGHPEPKFSRDNVGVTVTLLSKESLGPVVISEVREDPHRLTHRQLEIVNFLMQHGKAGLSDISERLSNPLATRTLQLELSKLKKAGVINMQGFGRGAKWILANNKGAIKAQ